MVFEGQVLQGEQEDRKPRALARFGKLLQNVGVGGRLVTDRFEILAELVDDQKQRSVCRQTPGDLDHRGRGRSGFARIV